MRTGPAGALQLKNSFCPELSPPQAIEARLVLMDPTARVNSCPSQERFETEFFSSRSGKPGLIIFRRIQFVVRILRHSFRPA
jgi:hypothetical protein